MNFLRIDKIGTWFQFNDFDEGIFESIGERKNVNKIDPKKTFIMGKFTKKKISCHLR